MHERAVDKSTNMNEEATFIQEYKIKSAKKKIPLIDIKYQNTQKLDTIEHF